MNELQALAAKYGLSLAIAAERAFAEWLLTRPRVAKRPLLVKLLKVLKGL